MIRYKNETGVAGVYGQWTPDVRVYRDANLSPFEAESNWISERRIRDYVGHVTVSGDKLNAPYITRFITRLGSELATDYGIFGRSSTGRIIPRTELNFSVSKHSDNESTLAFSRACLEAVADGRQIKIVGSQRGRDLARALLDNVEPIDQNFEGSHAQTAATFAYEGFVARDVDVAEMVLDPFRSGTMQFEEPIWLHVVKGSGALKTEDRGKIVLHPAVGIEIQPDIDNIVSSNGHPLEFMITNTATSRSIHDLISESRA
ncbi:MAG: hypothetical protein AAF413_04505 [Patescibacteria group bacterium]